MRAKITILSICLLAAFAGTAMAQTPDGLTPAIERVCDDQFNGAAWGLCNAYCEAMDCDFATPNANPNACASVAGKFAQKGGFDVADVDTKCQPCPCLDAENWPGDDDTWDLTVSGGLGSCHSSSTTTVLIAHNAPSGGSGTWVSVDGDVGKCEYGTISGENLGPFANQLTGLTADQVSACAALLSPPC